MKVIIYDWEVGMHKLPLAKFLRDDYGFTDAMNRVTGLIQKGKKEICFEISQETKEEVEAKLTEFKVLYRIIE